MQIQQDQVGLVRLIEAQHLARIGCALEIGIADLIEEPFKQPHICLLVIHDQDPHLRIKTH